MLYVDLRHRQGAFSIEAGFTSSGRLTALFGPSGSGKSSLINLIAGLIRPDEGRIEVDGKVLVDTRAGVFIPRHKRRIGMVFQDARLFPHMSVRSNLLYGRWFTPATERYLEMDAIVDLLGIGALLERKPSRLSGGEKQRVAIGRALLSCPRLLLMDEPLASLDEARKAEILPLIEHLRDQIKIPIVYVSHSVAEVARLASDVVVLAQGKVRASGPVSDILQRLDLLPAGERGEGGALVETLVLGHDDAYSMMVLSSPAGEIRVPRIDKPEGSSVRLRIRARDVIVARQKPEGLSALNILPGKIAAITHGEGAEAEVLLDCNGVMILSRITGQSCQMLGLEPGLSIFAVVKTVSFDETSTTRALYSQKESSIVT
ncbi:molybdenum ABC transporter ATP-binding protein [Aquamicrobium segne]|uniref:Molybdenum ABC transporter ATP-binding protein n=1 Tax=Aquamicrobium segne TaxID=469547 RepID=A0ABW0H2T1_9HYPH